MPAPKNTLQIEKAATHPEILQLPRSEVTLAALDILLENPMKSMNGMELMKTVEKKLRRKVNYSGVLKQVRLYARKPFWNLVLVCEKKSTLHFYARKGPLTQQLHREIHGLYNLSYTLSEVKRLKRKLENLKNTILTDPFVNMKEVQRKRQMIEKKMHVLFSQLTD